MTHDGMHAPSPEPRRGPASFRFLTLLPLLVGYLKLWQLSKPLLASFDAIFVDEAQDCTPGDKPFRTPVVPNT